MTSRSERELRIHDERLPDVSALRAFHIEVDEETRDLVIDWNKPEVDVKRPLEPRGDERLLYTYVRLRNYSLGSLASLAVFSNGGPEAGLPTAGIVMSAAWLDARRERHSFQREMLANQASRVGSVFGRSGGRARESEQDEKLHAIGQHEAALRDGDVFESKPHRILHVPAGETNFAGMTAAEDFVSVSERLYDIGLLSGVTVHTRQELFDERSTLLRAVDAYDSAASLSNDWLGVKGRYGGKRHGPMSPARAMIDEWLQSQANGNASRAELKERQLRDVQSKLVELGSSNTLASLDLQRLVHSIASHPYGDDLLEATIGQLYSLTQFVTKQRWGDRTWAHTGDTSQVLLGELTELADSLEINAYTIKASE